MNIEEQKIVSCECGCGITFNRFDSRGRERTFKRGHCPSPRHTSNTLETFWSFVKLPFEPTDEDCWEWIGPSIRRGYGRFSIAGGKIAATEFILLRYRGIKLEGDRNKDFVICHRCNIPSCVNPNHLEVKTQKDNVEDSFRAGNRLRNFTSQT